MIFDKHGKEFCEGDWIIYSKYLATVKWVHEDSLDIIVSEYDNLLLKIYDEEIKKVKIVTEEEVTMFLLKRKSNDAG
jgi:hypothetical protein